MTEPRPFQTLGEVTFTYDPETINPMPESRKTVATVLTYTGAALFEWEPFIQGEEITLTWSLMPVAMYDDLRELYLAGGIYTWDTRNYHTYQVAILDLRGKYVDAVFDQNPWRLDVELKLQIRSETVSEPEPDPED